MMKHCTENDRERAGSANTDRAPARLTSAGAGILAGSVLLDSGVEHYRGGFHNPAMLLPLAASGVSIGLEGARALGRGGGPFHRRPCPGRVVRGRIADRIGALVARGEL